MNYNKIMDKETKEKATMLLNKMGVNSEMMDDDYMQMGAHHLIAGASKMANAMMAKGMSEKQIMNAMKKASEVMMDKEMMMEMQETW